MVVHLELNHFIKGASLTLDESSVKQSIKDQDNVILTTTVLDPTSIIC